MSANPALGVHGPHLPSEGRVRGCGLTLAYRDDLAASFWPLAVAPVVILGVAVLLLRKQEK